MAPKAKRGDTQIHADVLVDEVGDLCFCGATLTDGEGDDFYRVGNEGMGEYLPCGNCGRKHYAEGGTFTRPAAY